MGPLMREYFIYFEGKAAQLRFARIAIIATEPRKASTRSGQCTSRALGGLRRAFAALRYSCLGYWMPPTLPPRSELFTLRTNTSFLSRNSAAASAGRGTNMTKG